MISRKSTIQKFFGEKDEITETDNIRDMLGQLEKWISLDDKELIHEHWKLIQKRVNLNTEKSKP